MLEQDYLMRILLQFAEAIRRSWSRAVEDRDPRDAANMLERAVGDATDIDGATLLSLSPESIASVMQVSGVDPRVSEYIARSLLLASGYLGEAGEHELAALRAAAEAGELDAGALGPVPLDGAALESVRMEDGAAVLALRGEKAAAWLSSEPLDRLGVYSVPWRGSARPGVLYTEYLGSGWYAGYACLGWG